MRNLLLRGLRHRGEQRHPVRRERPEGRALRAALRAAEDPLALPAEHHGLHGGQGRRF